MKNTDLKSRDNLQETPVMEAIILGYIVRIDNKISLGRYNKIAKMLELDRRTKEEMVLLRNEVQDDKRLTQYFEEALKGNISINDLEVVSSRGQEQPYKPIETEGEFETLAPYVVAHEEALAINREFKQAQRTGAHFERMFNGLKHHLVKELKLDNQLKITTTESRIPVVQDKELILALSDWHVGARVDRSETGGYNYSILVDRVSKMVKEAVNTAKQHDINRVHCFFIGDLIEHISMRNVNQAFEAEFPATEQIAKGIRLLTDVINELAKEIKHVNFGIVGGNHDRFQGNKNDKIYNDNVAYVVLDTLLLLQHTGGIPSNVTIIDNREDVYSFVTKVAGHPVKVIHGDTEAKKDDTKIRKHIRREEISYLFLGHIHTARIIQEDYSRYHVYVGSTMGTNNYSTENNFPTTDPTQCLVILERDKHQPIFNPITLS